MNTIKRVYRMYIYIYIYICEHVYEREREEGGDIVSHKLLI